MSTIVTKGLRFLLSRRGFLVVSGIALAGGIIGNTGHALAETAAAPVGQMALTAKHVEQYIASFKELSPLFEKLDTGTGEPDPKVLAEVESVVKKYGFRDLAEYDVVANSIGAVLDGIDPQTKQYSDPVALIKQAIADVQADKTMSAADRRKAIEELNAELAEAQSVQHPENIQTVLKFFDRLSALAPAQ